MSANKGHGIMPERLRRMVTAATDIIDAEQIRLVDEIAAGCDARRAKVLPGIVAEAMQHAGGNLDEAAGLLGLSYAGLRKMLIRFEMHNPDPKRSEQGRRGGKQTQLPRRGKPTAPRKVTSRAPKKTQTELFAETEPRGEN